MYLEGYILADMINCCKVNDVQTFGTILQRYLYFISTVHNTVSLAQHIIEGPVCHIVGITFASESLLRSYKPSYEHCNSEFENAPNVGSCNFRFGCRMFSNRFGILGLAQNITSSNHCLIDASGKTMGMLGTVNMEVKFNPMKPIVHEFKVLNTRTIVIY